MAWCRQTHNSHGKCSLSAHLILPLPPSRPGGDKGCSQILARAWHGMAIPVCLAGFLPFQSSQSRGVAQQVSPWLARLASQGPASAVQRKEAVPDMRKNRNVGISSSSAIITVISLRGGKPGKVPPCSRSSSRLLLTWFGTGCGGVLGNGQRGVCSRDVQSTSSSKRRRGSPFVIGCGSCACMTAPANEHPRHLPRQGSRSPR